MVAEYDARTDRLSEAEQLRMLEVLDRLCSEPEWHRERELPGDRRPRLHK